MFCLISDPHGGESTAGLEKALALAKESDLIIILGDLELNFRDTEQNRRFTEYFMSLKANIAIVDGNHDNYPYLYSFPKEQWNGGTVHRMTEHIVYLTRGSIYKINEKSFFVMGGSKSSAKWKEMGLWYPEELPSEEELALGYKNLEAHKNKVDYILTHRYDTKKTRDTANPEPMSLLGLIDYIDKNVEFTHWYMGHGHKNKCIDGRHTMVYDEPLMLE